MRIVCIGDIGVTDDVIHVGDEAMFEQLVTQLRLRGVTAITAVSSNPAETADRYDVDAISRIGFPTGGHDAQSAGENRMDAVLRTATGEKGLLGPDDTAHAVIAAISHSDGVTVAGGGNLSSLWPTHIFERSTIGRIAAILDKPLVVTGQTIGPYLTPDHAALVAALLTSARLVGVREGRSLALARDLGVPGSVLNLTVDDASFLGISAAIAGVGGGTMPVAVATTAEPYCAVTLAAHINGADSDVFDQRAAELLDEIALSTGLAIVFLAHFGSTREGVAHGDTIVHRRVMARMTATRVRIAPTIDSTAAAALGRSASLVVTSRYHPAVFAVAAGVPTIGIPVDDYTTAKLTGALENFGQDGILPIAELFGGSGPALAARIWAARAATLAHGGLIRSRRLAESSAWWDQVTVALRPQSGPSSHRPTIVG